MFFDKFKVWRVVVYGWIPRILDEGIAVRRQPVRIQHKFQEGKILTALPTVRL